MKTFCLLLVLCLVLALVASGADAVSDFDPADDEKEEKREKRIWGAIAGWAVRGIGHLRSDVMSAASQRVLDKTLSRDSSYQSILIVFRIHQC
ncbi:hypothetical protein C0Q70_16457 [Pomacea canaliculata]|uniref:Uncharacterized protein n=1 Tax=Pomacea canaliculata TaxID=400727 RepID=A0A2T7NPU6_POMCA|nr:hypothetical protein C0Q70_16457 [Pomacea canaliculata]